MRSVLEHPCALPPGHRGRCVRGLVADGVPLCDRHAADMPAWIVVVAIVLLAVGLVAGAIR